MKKILMIDDDKKMCLYVKESLEITGRYSVIVSTNPRDGLSYASSFNPDLVLLDVMMPEMSGFEVLKRLKADEKTASIPVIMLTAVDTAEAKEKALGFYDDDYVVKPVSISALMEKIGTVLARRF